MRHVERDMRRASGALRRKVIAGVRSQPAAAGRPALAWAWSALLALAASALAVAVLQASRAPRKAGLISSSLGGARATLGPAGSATELSLTGMPLPPAGRTYQLWLLADDGSLRALGEMFTVTRAGRASVALPGDLRRVRELILTREPIGGSAAPSGPPLLEILDPSALVG